jgi:hypothetical protein
MKDDLPFGWGLAAVGTTVAKDFGKREGGIFHGVVKAYDPGGKGEVDLYRIEYADGDKEDMEKHEFQAAHEFANKIHLKESGTKLPPTKKIKKEEPAAVPKSTNVDGVPKGVPKGTAWSNQKEGDRAILITAYLWRGDFVGADAFMDSKRLDHMDCLTRSSLQVGLTVLQDTVHGHANSKLGLDVATWLLSKGVSADSAGRLGSISGTAPLYLAADLNDLAMVQLLLGHGADPNRLSSGGSHNNSSLYLCAERGSVAVAQALIAHGADVEKPDSGDGSTPLCVACLNGHLEIVQMLLQAGADPNKAKTSGTTPLYFCAQGDHLPIAKLLIKAGAEANKPAFRGFTPLQVASDNGHREMIKLLKSAGA